MCAIRSIQSANTQIPRAMVLLVWAVLALDSIESVALVVAVASTALVHAERHMFAIACWGESMLGTIDLTVAIQSKDFSLLL